MEGSAARESQTPPATGLDPWPLPGSGPASVKDRLRGEIVASLVSESRSAEAMHLAAVVVVSAFLFHSASHRWLAAWAVAICMTTLIRAATRIAIRRRSLVPEAALRSMRIAVTLVALSWGVGAALLLPHLPFDKTALLLVVLSGIAAGAAGTLIADLRAYRCFLGGLLGPLPLVLATAIGTPDALAAALLIAVFGGAMLVFHTRAHRLYIEHARSTAEAERIAAVARRERAHLDALMEAAPTAIAWTDADGRILGVNSRFEALFGYAGSEIVGQELNPLVVPESDREAAVSLDQRVKVGETVQIEAMRRRKDGSLLAVRASAAQVDQGEWTTMFVMYEDVTERRLAEEAVLQSEERFRSLAESAPIGIFMADADGRCVYTNPAWRELSGLAFEETLGEGWRRAIHPEDREAVGNDWERHARSGREFAAEFRFLRPDASVRWIRGSAVAVRTRDGRTIGYVGTMDDITDRRRAEESLREAERHYRELVESASDLVWQVDANRCWSYVNAAAEGIYGLPARELLGRPFRDFVAEEHVASDSAALESVLAGGELSDHETVHRGLGQGLRRLSFAARPVRNAEGHIVGAHGIARDITERAAAAQALREARDAAEHASRARASFLANMSHEIRTPMNAVLGLTEIVLDSELAPDQRRSLELVRSSADSLLTIINDILDFSKIEAEHLEIEAIPFDLPGLVDSVVRLLAVRARERGIAVLADVSGGVPESVRGDPTRLRQVLVNLVGNAIKFTHQGEVVVSVRAEGEIGDRRPLRFAVRDTGIGIPADQLGHVFDEFSQADASMTRRYGGTGLGLAIARKLVRLMGGEIEVESREGAGSEFSFVLPLAVESQEQARPGSDLADDADIEGLSALVVDDNATNRRILREMLVAAGMRVAEAGNAEEALAALAAAATGADPYAIVLLDAQMPVSSGFDLARTIRANEQLAELRLMLLTSAGQRGDGQLCRELGIQGYLTKPVSRTDLRDAVAAVLYGIQDPKTDGVVTRHSIAESRKVLHILLAEDNPVNQLVAATMLRRRGHEVDVVNNGREAVQAVERRRPDLVLMDVQMPEMDGFEATAAIRALPGGASLPIIALTAHALAGERERCREKGMDDYLSKPFQAHELFALVEGRGASSASPAGTEEREAAGAAHAVDLGELRRQFREAGIEDALGEVLDAFRSTAAARLTELLAAGHAGDAARIARAAHAFKSAAGTILAARLAERLIAIERLALALDVAGARERLAGVEADVEAVLGELAAA